MDIVAGGLASLAFSNRWRMQLRDYDWPWYLAVQDGMSVEDVEPHLRLYAGIFLGGTDRFKATAYRWSQLAHKYQLRFHYGRAGTRARLIAAFRCGADSLDSSFPLWTAERMRIFCAWHSGLLDQREMEFEEDHFRDVTKMITCPRPDDPR